MHCVCIVPFNMLRSLGLIFSDSLRFLGPFFTPKWQVPTSLKYDLPPPPESVPTWEWFNTMFRPSCARAVLSGWLSYRNFFREASKSCCYANLYGYAIFSIVVCHSLRVGKNSLGGGKQLEEGRHCGRKPVKNS